MEGCRRWARATAARGPGRSDTPPGLVDRRRPRHDGRRRPDRAWAPPSSTSGRRSVPGPAPSPTSTGPPARWRPRSRRKGSGRARWSCSSCRTGSRPASRSGPRPTSGAVVVPVVHFYGAEGGRLHPRGHRARRGGHRRALRPRRPPGELRGPPRRPTRAPLARRRGHPRERAARPAPTAFARLLEAEPLVAPAARRPGRAGDHRLHLGHDPRPQGRHPLPPDDRLRDPPARPHVPRRAGRPRSPARRSATSSGCSTPSWCPCCATGR